MEGRSVLHYHRRRPARIIVALLTVWWVVFQNGQPVRLVVVRGSADDTALQTFLLLMVASHVPLSYRSNNAKPKYVPSIAKYQNGSAGVSALRLVPGARSPGKGLLCTDQHLMAKNVDTWIRKGDVIPSIALSTAAPRSGLPIVRVVSRVVVATTLVSVQLFQPPLLEEPNARL